MENNNGFLSSFISLVKYFFMLVVFVFLAACDNEVVTSLSTSSVGGDDCLLVNGGWVKELIPGQHITAGYPLLNNRCDTDIVISSVMSPNAKAIEIHQHEHSGTMMRMVQRTELLVKANSTFHFSPGDFHLMIFNPVFNQGNFLFNIVYQENDNRKILSVELPVKNLTEQMESVHE